MIERIIVGVDFSEGSRAALWEGERLAEQFDVPCTAVHVLHPDTPVFPEPFPAYMDSRWYQEEDLILSHHLEEWVRPLPKTVATVRTGDPAQELVKIADTHALLVVGHEHHSFLTKLVFGSTTRWVLDHAPCPVLVVPVGDPPQDRKDH